MDPDPEPLLLSASIDFLTSINIVVLLILLICSALISGTEVAFFSLSQTDLDELSDDEKEENQDDILEVGGAQECLEEVGQEVHES